MSFVTRGRPLLLAFAVALIVIAASGWVIAVYGSPTPYWDQWDAEARALFEPWLSGTLRFRDLFAPHNEHRIALSRLLSLGLLILNGYWDPILEMAVGALFHGAAAAALVLLFRHVLTGVEFGVLVIFSAVALAVPFSWETVIHGLGNQYYLLLLCSFSSIALCVRARAWTLQWFAGMLLAIAGYFTVASAALTIAVLAIMALLQIRAEGRNGPGEWFGIAAQAIIVVVMVRAVPALQQHDELKAHSAGAFLAAISNYGSWPLVPYSASLWLKFFLSFAVHWPALMLLPTLLRKLRDLREPAWVLVALAGWLALQMGALAYGRAEASMSSRYLDMLMTLLVFECACLLVLLSTARDARWRATLFALASAWLVVVMLGIALRAKDAQPHLENFSRAGTIQVENLRNYLATGDMGFLRDKPERYIPYPDANRLAEIASSPQVRSILPPPLVNSDVTAAAQSRGIARSTNKLVLWFRNLVLVYSPAVGALGFALLCAGLLSLSPRIEDAAAEHRARIRD